MDLEERTEDFPLKKLKKLIKEGKEKYNIYKEKEYE